MAEQKNHEFEFYCREVEKFLAGERTNPLISTTKFTARKLEKRYNITMSLYSAVSAKHGIYLFKIT